MFGKDFGKDNDADSIKDNAISNIKGNAIDNIKDNSAGNIAIGEALQESIRVLKQSGIDSPAADAGVLLSFILKKDRSYLYTHPDEKISYRTYARFMDAVNERKKGKPVQYITGTQEFFSLPFKVGPEVLIPRPETELLVEKVIQWARQKPDVNGGRPLKILDLCTGSGCIGISIARGLPDSCVLGVDLSEDALKTAEENAALNGVKERVKFCRGDLFGALNMLPQNVGGEFHPPYDTIVSNPPYIPSGEIPGLDKQVREYEPILALDGGRDGLDFYRKIIEKAPLYLAEGGLLALEIGYDQGEKIRKLICDDGRYRDVRLDQDYSGLDRIITAVL